MPAKPPEVLALLQGPNATYRSPIVALIDPLIKKAPIVPGPTRICTGRRPVDSRLWAREVEGIFRNPTWRIMGLSN